MLDLGRVDVPSLLVRIIIVILEELEDKKQWPLQSVQSGNIEEANLKYGFVVPVRVDPAQLLSQPVVGNVGQSIKTWKSVNQYNQYSVNQ